MSTINPAHPQLRRVHPVDPTTLQEKKTTVGEWKPVLLEWRRVAGREVIIVWNGTHRMQAALEEGLDAIAYEQIDEQRLAEELQRTPFRSPAVFLRRMRRFRIREYD